MSMDVVRREQTRVGSKQKGGNGNGNRRLFQKRKSSRHGPKWLLRFTTRSDRQRSVDGFPTTHTSAWDASCSNVMNKRRAIFRVRVIFLVEMSW